MLLFSTMMDINEKMTREKFFELIEELARVGRKTFDVPPLALGVQRIERKRAFPAPAHPANDDKFSMRNIQINVFQIVDRDFAQNDFTASSH